MNLKLLIDAIVRHTTVLIAQLATASGGRAPLAHVANQVFLDLVGELESQGVRRKVAADMFGLALRSYQKKVQRLSESLTERGKSLWEAVFDYLLERGVTSRAAVLSRFVRDDEAMVRGILQDLVETGLVFKTGAAHSTAYRVATDEELGRLGRADRDQGAATLIWLTIYREGPLSRDQIQERLHLDEGEIDELLEQLVGEGRATVDEQDAERRYASGQFSVPMASPIGWEAAVLDHYQAVVSTICGRLQDDLVAAVGDHRLGGSTYSFDVWDGHPEQSTVLDLLQQTRALAADLRERVMSHAESLPTPASYTRVTFYMGQLVTPMDLSDDDGDSG